MDQERNLQEVGMKILRCALVFAPGEDKTMFLATDGEVLWYNGNYLADRFLRGGNEMNRIYLHTVLHCLLRHIAKKQGRDSAIWDLSCDIVVESVLDSLTYACLTAPVKPLRHKIYGELRREMQAVPCQWEQRS